MTLTIEQSYIRIPRASGMDDYHALKESEMTAESLEMYLEGNRRLSSGMRKRAGVGPYECANSAVRELARLDRQHN